MLKGLLFTSLFAFCSSSPVLYENKAPFKQVNTPSYSAYNENLNYYDYTYLMFSKVNATFVPQATTYFYSYRHNTMQMGSTAYNNFQNGSSNLIYQIPSYLNVDTSRSSEFYLQVNSTKYYFENGLGYITNEFYTIPNFFDFSFIATTDIYISIPSYDTQAVSGFNSALDNSILFTRQAFRVMLMGNEYINGYEDGYNDGIADGYNDGYYDGNNDGYYGGYDDGNSYGYQNGYNVGFNEGQNSDFNSYSWITGIFSAMGAFLSIQLLPNVTIGGVVILIMVLTLLPFLIGLLKGGKG